MHVAMTFNGSKLLQPVTMWRHQLYTGAGFKQVSLLRNLVRTKTRLLYLGKNKWLSIKIKKMKKE